MKKIDWYSIKQKVIAVTLSAISVGFLGLVYTAYSQAQETPKRVDSLEIRMEKAEIQIARLDTLVTDINQKMEADSTTQLKIIEGIDELLERTKEDGQDED